MRGALKERLATLRTKSGQTASEYLAYLHPSLFPLPFHFVGFFGLLVDGSELSSEKMKMTAQIKLLTSGIRQFIRDDLAGILHAESKGANPGEPESLPKKKRRRDDDDEAAEKDLASRMVTLVEVQNPASPSSNLCAFLSFPKSRMLFVHCGFGRV